MANLVATTITGDLTVDTDTLYVDSTNNRVGIGTTSPQTPLHVYRDSAGTSNIRLENTESYIELRADEDAGIISANTHIFQSKDGSTERMRINSSGQVIVGGTSAENSSVVLEAQGDTNPIIQVEDTTNNIRCGIQAGDSVANIRCPQDNDLVFTVGASEQERMRITSSGRVLIGTTTNAKQLRVEADSAYNTEVVKFQAKNTSDYTSSVFAIEGGRATVNGTYYLAYWINGNSSGVFRVLDSGNAQNTNNSYGGTSDLKLKENIVDANSQWEDIKALPIKKYSFKFENSETPTKIGVIAQDLETAGMNGLVEETVDRDEDGNDLGTTTKSVKYSVLYMKSVKALQEALIEIDNLKARVDTLEGN